MKLSAFFVSLALASFALFSPAIAGVPDGPKAIERLDCTAADFTAADFATAIVSPAVEQFPCDAALLAESGLCIVKVEPARVGFAFAQPPDPVFVAAAGTCLGGRSPTG